MGVNEKLVVHSCGSNLGRFYGPEEAAGMALLARFLGSGGSMPNSE